MPPRRAPVVRVGRVLANAQNNEQLRRGRRQREEDGGEIAQPAVVRPRHEERGPNWTLDSKITDVLLEEYGKTLGISVDVFFARYSESRNIRHRKGGDSLSSFMRDPLQYVSEEGLRRVEKWGSYRCFKAANDLNEKGVVTLEKWEETAAKKKIPLLVRGVLDAAVNSARRREALTAQSVSGQEIEGAYDSIYNAAWSYVESGHEGFPFGMRVFAGRPNRMWSRMEVDVNIGYTEIGHMGAQRVSDLEICVITSKRGWPYNLFRTGGDNPLVKSRGDRIHVYIRREIMRVWYMIKHDADAWLVKELDECPTPYIVIGTPGIGKSYGLGSFLLHSLLHFHGGVLDVVAYFMSKSAYLIYNEREGVPGKVVRYNSHQFAVEVISNMQWTKKGYIIVDICTEGQTPHFELPFDLWAVVVLTSPDEDHYYHWSKDKRARSVVINCDQVRDIQAFVIWRKLSPLPSWVDLSEEERSAVVKELNEEWCVVEKRIESVGPIPRHVLDAPSYSEHLNSVYAALRKIDGTLRDPYRKLIGDAAAWQSNEVSHKLVKIVRVSGRVGVPDSYRCRATSEMVEQLLVGVVCLLLMEDPSLCSALNSAGVAGYSLLEAYAWLAFRVPRVFCTISRRLEYLPREGETRKGSSILSNMTEEQLKLGACIPLPAAGQECIPECKYMVLYVPSTRTHAVVDGFFFVEGRFRRRGRGTRGEAPSKTIVLLQVTTSARHHTGTSKVQEFKNTIANVFVNWGTFSQDMSWEIIYVNKADGGVITARQRCGNSGRTARKSGLDPAADALQGEDPADTLEFWDRIDQYQVTLGNTVHAQMLIAYNRAQNKKSKKRRSKRLRALRW